MAKLWLFGLLAEVALCAVLYVVGRHQAGPADNAELLGGERILAAAKSQPPLDVQTRDSVLGAVADSLGLRVEHGDGRLVVHGPPGFERGLDRMMTSIGEGVLYAMVWAASIVLPIPLVLLSLTVLWLWARWRLRRGRLRSAA